jgi:hypothetical protein
MDGHERALTPGPPSVIRARVFSNEASVVNLASVSNPCHINSSRAIVNFVDDTVIADANPLLLVAAL